MSDKDTHKTELAAIREAAHIWRARLDDELASDKDHLAFRHWLSEDIRHQEEYSRIDALWGQLGTIAEDELTAENRNSLNRVRAVSVEKAASHVNETPNIVPKPVRIDVPHRLRLVIGSVMATAALVMIVYLPDRFHSATEIKTPIITSYSTERGEVNQITLADGSTANLGADSTIEFTMSPNSRSVTLIQGEAFFAVTKQQDQPFTVAAGKMRIEVTGTAFGVRLGATRTDVAVSEGNVRVSYPMMIGGKPNPTMRSTHQVSAGTAVTATPKEGLLAPSPVRADAVAPWRSGRLVYIAAPLVEVVADANRYSATPIVLDDETVGSITVSGSFNADETTETLHILSETMGFDIDFSRPDEIRITHTGN
ncbi:MAG: FecR domain-containing protein [Pseudomonadota bacterium]